MAKFSSLGIYAPKVEERPQERPTWDASSFIGQFAAGFMEGLTTFDVLGKYNGDPDTSAEQIARSFGSVLGFVGFIPTPAGMSKLGLNIAAKGARLLGESARATELTLKAARIAYHPISVPMVAGRSLSKLSMTGLTRAFEMSAAKNMLKFGEELTGKVASASFKGTASHLAEQGLFMGFASAAGARPLNPLDIFTDRMWEDRAEAFARGVPMGVLQSGIANAITPKLMKGLGAASFETLDPGKQQILLKTLRGVSVGLTMGGYAAAEGYPTELALYETLVNGVFGYRELPWYDHQAMKLMDKHLKEAKISKWAAARNNGRVFLEEMGEKDLPPEVVNSFEQSANAHFGHSARLNAAYLNGYWQAEAERRGVPVETIKGDMHDMAESLEAGGFTDEAEFARSLMMTQEIITAEKDKLIEQYRLDNDGLMPSEEELAQFEHRANERADEVLVKLWLNNADAAAQVKEVARRVHYEKDMIQKVPDQLLKIFEGMRSDGISLRVADFVVQFSQKFAASNKSPYESLKSMNDTFLKFKKAKQNDFEVVKGDIETKLGITFDDSEQLMLRRIWAGYVNAKPRVKVRIISQDGEYHPWRETDQTKNGEPIYSYENETPIEKRLGKPAISVTHALVNDELVPVNKANLNLPKMIVSMMKHGYSFYSGKKDNADLRFFKIANYERLTQYEHRLGKATIDIASELNGVDMALGREVGTSLDVYNKDREAFAERAAEGVAKTRVEVEKKVAREVYDRLYAFNVMDWMHFNKVKSLGEAMKFDVNNVYKFNKRTQLMFDVGIEVDPKIVGKEKLSARIIDFTDDSKGVWKMFDIKKPNGEVRNPLQYDGVVWMRKTLADKLGLYTSGKSAGFHKISVVDSDEFWGGFFGKQGVHVMSQADEAALDKAGVKEDLVFFDSAAKLKGRRQTTKLRVDENGEATNQDGITVTDPEAPHPFSFEIPTRSLRMNLSAVEDLEMGSIHWVKQLLNHFEENPELTRHIMRKYILPNADGDKNASMERPAKREKASINIWYASNEAKELSNLAERPFEYDGKRYFSVEHAYQTLKSGSFDKETYDAYTGGGVKIPGKLPVNKDISMKLMEDLIRASFAKNPEAIKALVRTGDAKLTHVQDAGIWKTAFPEILTKIRSEFTADVQDEGPTVRSMSDIDKTLKTNTERFRLGKELPIGAKLDVDIDKVPLADLFQVLQDMPNDARLAALVKKLMGYHLAVSDQLDGEYGEFEHINSLLTQRMNIAKKLAGQDKLSPMFLADPRVYSYMEQALYNYALQRLHRPVYRNSFKTKLGFLSPFERIRIEKELGREMGEKDVVLEGGLKNYPVALDGDLKELRELFAGKEEIPLFALWQKRSDKRVADFFARFAGVRVPLSDLSGTRVMNVVGWVDTGGTRIFVHPHNMKYMDGADLDGDSAFMYMGFDKRLTDYLDTPTVKHRFTRWWNVNDPKETYTLKNVPPELIDGDTYQGRKFHRDFAGVKEGNELLLGDNPTQYAHLKDPALMFSAGARATVNQLASVGKDNLGPGLVAALRAKQFHKFLMANGGIFIVKDFMKGMEGEFRFVAKPNLDDQKMTQFQTVNLSADAADGVDMADVDKVRAANLVSVMDVYKDGKKLSPKEARDILGTRIGKVLPMHKLPGVREIYDMDIAIRPREYDGKAKTLFRIMDDIKRAQTAIHSLFKMEDRSDDPDSKRTYPLENIWYNTAEVLSGIDYSIKVQPHINAVSYKVMNEALDAFFKSAEYHLNSQYKGKRNEKDALPAFILRMTGRIGLSFNRSRITEVPTWNIIKDSIIARHGEKALDEWKKEFFRSETYDFRDTRLWKYLKKFPQSVKGQTADITQKVIAEMSERVIQERRNIVSEDKDSFVVADERGRILRTFMKKTPEENLKAAQRYVEKNGGTLRYRPRPEHEIVYEMRKLAFKDDNEVTSIFFLNDHLSKYIDEVKPENINAFIDDKLVPWFEEISAMRQKLIDTQQDVFNASMQNKRSASRTFTQVMKDIADYRLKLSQVERPAFDAMFISMIQPRGIYSDPDTGMNRLEGELLKEWKTIEAKVRQEMEMQHRHEGISERDLTNLITEQTLARWKYHNNYAESPILSGLVSDGMVRDYYSRLNKLSDIYTMDPEDMNVRELFNELNLDPYKGVPGFIANDEEASKMETRKELTKVVRRFAGPYKDLVKRASSVNSMGEVRDPIERAKYHQIEMDLKDIFLRYGDIAEQVAWIMPSIVAERTGGKVHRTIEGMTFADWNNFIDMFKTVDGKWKNAEEIGVKKSWFFRQFASIAAEKRAHNPRILPYRAKVMVDGEPKEMIVKRIVGAMEQGQWMAESLVASKNTADAIVNQAMDDKLWMFKQLMTNDKNGLGLKLFKAAVGLVEGPLGNPEKTPVGWELYMNNEADAHAMLETLRTKYPDGLNLVDKDGHTKNYTITQLSRMMHDIILDYQENVMGQELTAKPDDAMVFSDDMIVGRFGTRGQFTYVDVDKFMDRLVGYDLEHGRAPLLSRRATATLAASETLKNVPIRYYVRGGKLVFDGLISQKGRDTMEKEVAEGKATVGTTTFENASPDVRNALIDRAWRKGHIFGYPVDAEEQSLRQIYFPHVILSDKVVEGELRKRLEKMGTFTIEEIKKMRPQLIRYIMATRDGKYDPENGQQIFARLRASENALESMSYKSVFLRGRDHSEFGPMPDWDMSPFALRMAHQKLIRENADMLFAVRAHNLLRRQTAEQPYGENSKHILRFMERHFRQTLGYADTMPKDWGDDYQYGIDGRLFHRYSSDAYYIKKIQDIGNTWFGGKTMGEFKQIERFADKLKFETPNDRQAWVLEGKRLMAERKLSWLSQMEAKYALLSLLVSTKTFVTNVSSAALMTLINTSREDWFRATSFKEIQNELGVENVSSPGDVDRIVGELGALEGMFQQELNIYGGMGYVGSEAMTEIMADLKARGVNADIKGILTKRGVYKRLVDAGAYMMKQSELIARRHSLLAHYMNARRSLRQQGFELAWDDPWIIKIARNGVAASQFLYSNAHRPAFMGSMAGKILHRFQLFAYNSIAFRANVLEQAHKAGITPGSEAYEKFQRMMMTDMFVFGMASMIPMSVFGTMLPPPYNYLNQLTEFFFAGDEKKRQDAFYGGLPYPLNITQPLTPPTARIFTIMLNYAYSGDAEKLGNGIASLVPGNRLAKDLWRSYDQISNKHRNPAIIIDNMTGFPLVASGGVIRKLEKDDGFEMYLEKYRGRGIYLEDAEKNEEDIDQYLRQMSSP